MRTIYNVTITDTAIDRFNSKTSRSLLENLTIDPQEAVLASRILENTPVGVQLHAHFQGNQLEYKNAETGEVIRFKHTYVKYAEGRIAAKPIRNSFIAAGSYGKVKLYIDIQTGAHIVAKEFFTDAEQFQTSERAQQLTSYYAKIMHTQNLTRSFNGQISQGIVHKQRNPFKKLLKQENTAPLDITYGDIVFSFQLTPEQKVATQHIANTKTNTPPRTNINDKDETKPLIYSEYRGYDLADFIKNNQLLPEDYIQLPRLIRESILTLDHKIHRKNILHCDINLKNMLILRDKITHNLLFFFCDPDLVSEMDPKTKMTIDRLKGTKLYYPPEFHFYLSEDYCKAHIDDGALDRRNRIRPFKDTVLPPNANPKDNAHVKFSPEVDIYALGRSWSLFLRRTKNFFASILKQQHPLKIKKHLDLRSLVSLMMHYHPSARPNLTLMQFAILPLEHDTLSEERLSTILEQQNLPNISLQNLNRLSDCMIQIARHFDHEEPRPFHFLRWLYQYIQDKLITPENSERDVTKFVEFICFLHQNNPTRYSMFSKEQARISLNEFLAHINHFYHLVEKYFFDHMAAFTISMQHKLALRWDHLAQRNSEASSHFTEIMQHYAHANQITGDANQSGNIICQQIIDRTRNLISNSSTDPGITYKVFFDVKNLDNIRPLFEGGKSIWEIISDVAQSEAPNEMNLRLLFKLAPQLHREEHFPLFRKNILGLAVNLNNIDRLNFVSDSVMFYKLGEAPTNSSRFFQTNSQSPRETYEFFSYCALINRLYLTAKEMARFNDTQLQSDITTLATFLESVRNNPLRTMTLIDELQVMALRSIINENRHLNALQRYIPSEILENASSDLLTQLHRGYASTTV